MPVEKKMDAPKHICKRIESPNEAPNAAPAAPSAALPQTIELKIALPTLTFDLGPGFQMKLVFLALMLLVFAFSLFVFTKTNFSTIDLVDFARLEYNVPKLWGVWFGVFAVLFSLSIALAVLYGHGTPKIQSVIPLVFAFLFSAIAGVLFPSFSMAFYGFALAVGITAISSSMHGEKLSLSSIWGTTSRALMVLLVVSLLFSYAKFSSNQNAYVDHLVGSIATSVPQIAGVSAPVIASQALGFCAAAVESVPINASVVRQGLSKDALANSLANSGNMLYLALPNSTKQQIVDSFYDNAVNQSVAMANGVKTEIASGLRKIDTTKLVENTTVSQVLTPEVVKSQLQAIPATKQLFQLFPVFAALMVLSLVSILNVLLHVLSTLFAWLLLKLLS